MTTRRRPLGPPPRGLIGLFGLPFAICLLSSVEAVERRVDRHGAPERPCERAACNGALEAREPAAGVRAASGAASRRKRAGWGVECDEVGLRRLTAAADTRADRPVSRR